MAKISRRAFVAAAPLALSACVFDYRTLPFMDLLSDSNVPNNVRRMYGAVTTEAYFLPAIDMSQIRRVYWRTVVDYPGDYAPGTIIVDTPNRFLYFILGSGRAVRYGIGVGKAGLALAGEAVVEYKRKWPNWVPTKDMMVRNPETYGHLGQGLPPGPDNPLGARALYLYRNGRDTLFRIHGSHEEWSIGQAMSSGCIRLLNQDIIDLYKRITNGARVIVLQSLADDFM